MYIYAVGIIYGLVYESSVLRVHGSVHTEWSVCILSDHAAAADNGPKTLCMRKGEKGRRGSCRRQFPLQRGSRPVAAALCIHNIRGCGPLIRSIFDNGSCQQPFAAAYIYYWYDTDGRYNGWWQRIMLSAVCNGFHVSRLYYMYIYYWCVYATIGLYYIYIYYIVY